MIWRYPLPRWPSRQPAWSVSAGSPRPDHRAYGQPWTPTGRPAWTVHPDGDHSTEGPSSSTVASTCLAIPMPHGRLDTMPEIKDLTGAQFVDLRVLRQAEIRGAARQVFWHCRCVCGKEVITSGSDLRSGHSKSCGCLRFRTASNLQHGHNRAGKPSRTYQSWRTMKARCANPTEINWHRYGGRGITVCDRWQKFENFLEDMGERPADRTLDRIDPDGNYELSNCRWATLKEQRANRRTR